MGRIHRGKIRLLGPSSLLSFTASRCTTCRSSMGANTTDIHTYCNTVAVRTTSWRHRGVNNRCFLTTLCEALKLRALPEETSRKVLRVVQDHTGSGVGSVQMTKITRVLLRAPEFSTLLHVHHTLSPTLFHRCRSTTPRSASAPSPVLVLPICPSCGLQARKQ